MTTLLYRGHKYIQHKQASDKAYVQLTYRRNLYSNATNQLTKEKILLTYRGKNYYCNHPQYKLVQKYSYKDRDLIFSLARQLVHAQFQLADEPLANRLWHDVTAHGIDPDRIINLMYRCHDHRSYESMLKADMQYENYQHINN